MKNIYEEEGVNGLVDALRYGTADADFYQLIEDKLGVTRDTFDDYIKTEMQNYPGSGADRQ
jgi:hypothetical protein